MGNSSDSGTPLTDVYGVGETTAERLQALGIDTAEELKVAYLTDRGHEVEQVDGLGAKRLVNGLRDVDVPLDRYDGLDAEWQVEVMRWVRLGGGINAMRSLQAAKDAGATGDNLNRVYDGHSDDASVTPAMMDFSADYYADAANVTAYIPPGGGLPSNPFEGEELVTPDGAFRADESMRSLDDPTLPGGSWMLTIVYTGDEVYSAFSREYVKKLEPYLDLTLDVDYERVKMHAERIEYPIRVDLDVGHVMMAPRVGDSQKAWRNAERGIIYDRDGKVAVPARLDDEEEDDVDDTPEEYGPDSTQPVPPEEYRDLPDGPDARRLEGTGAAPSDYELLNGQASATSWGKDFHPDDATERQRKEERAALERAVSKSESDETTSDDEGFTPYDPLFEFEAEPDIYDPEDATYSLDDPVTELPGVGRASHAEMNGVHLPSDNKPEESETVDRVDDGDATARRSKKSIDGPVQTIGDFASEGYPFDTIAPQYHLRVIEALRDTEGIDATDPDTLMAIFTGLTNAALYDESAEHIGGRASLMLGSVSMTDAAWSWSEKHDYADATDSDGQQLVYRNPLHGEAALGTGEFIPNDVVPWDEFDDLDPENVMKWGHPDEVAEGGDRAGSTSFVRDDEPAIQGIYSGQVRVDTDVVAALSTLFGTDYLDADAADHIWTAGIKDSKHPREGAAVVFVHPTVECYAVVVVDTSRGDDLKHFLSPSDFSTAARDVEQPAEGDTADDVEQPNDVDDVDVPESVGAWSLVDDVPFGGHLWTVGVPEGRDEAVSVWVEQASEAYFNVVRLTSPSGDPSAPLSEQEEDAVQMGLVTEATAVERAVEFMEDSTYAEGEGDDADNSPSPKHFGDYRREKVERLENTPHLDRVETFDTLEEMADAIEAIHVEGYSSPPENTLSKLRNLFERLPDAESERYYLNDYKLVRTINAARNAFNEWVGRKKRYDEMPGAMEAGPSNYPKKKQQRRRKSADKAREKLDEKLDRLNGRVKGAFRRALKKAGHSEAELNAKKAENKMERRREEWEPGDIVLYRSPNLHAGAIVRLNKKSVRVQRQNTLQGSDFGPDGEFQRETVDLDSDHIQKVPPDELGTIEDDNLDRGQTLPDTLKAAQRQMLGDEWVEEHYDGPEEDESIEPTPSHNAESDPIDVDVAGWEYEGDLTWLGPRDAVDGVKKNASHAMLQVAEEADEYAVVLRSYYDGLGQRSQPDTLSTFATRDAALDGLRTLIESTEEPDRATVEDFDVGDLARVRWRLDSIDYDDGGATELWGPVEDVDGDTLRVEANPDSAGFALVHLDERRVVEKNGNHQTQYAGDLVSIANDGPIEDELWYSTPKERMEAETERSGAADENTAPTPSPEDDGQQAAREALVEGHDLDADEARAILDGTTTEDGELPVNAKRALSTAWTAYKQAYKAGQEAVEAVEKYEEERPHAERSASIINGIREAYGQEPIEFDGIPRISEVDAVGGEITPESTGTGFSWDFTPYDPVSEEFNA